MNESFASEEPGEQGKGRRLLTFSSGGWVLLAAGFFSLVAAALVLYPVWDNGFRAAVGDGVHVETYGFDLSNLTIPRSELAASGMPKDGIKVIPQKLVETITPAEVDLIAKNEHIRFLVPDDRVIGLVIDGVARAYPLRVLAVHELVNDVLGDVPIAVTFTPLCDAVVVFDRRIDGVDKPPVEFGHSGLMRSSNSIFYDRRASAAEESLWPQLTFHAVAGPAAGKEAKELRALRLIPYALVKWKQWREAHPETRVLLGLRTMKAEYSGDPYSVYLQNDRLRFPTAAAAPNLPGGLPNKTAVELTTVDFREWTAHLSLTGAAEGVRIHSFLFAWFAQHPDDTDYGELASRKQGTRN